MFITVVVNIPVSAIVSYPAFQIYLQCLNTNVSKFLKPCPSADERLVFIQPGSDGLMILVFAHVAFKKKFYGSMKLEDELA